MCTVALLLRVDWLHRLVRQGLLSMRLSMRLSMLLLHRKAWHWLLSMLVLMLLLRVVLLHRRVGSEPLFRLLGVEVRGIWLHSWWLRRMPGRSGCQ